MTLAREVDVTVALPSVPGFVLEECLGRGGMGVVYRARREADGELLALKMILTERRRTYQELARFRIEAEALACLKHSHIVRIRGVGVYAGSPYYALEFASQGTLKERIARGPIPCREAATLAWQIASAVQHAHSRGILHRDLKPANILIMENGTPKVSDFGLVKFLQPVREVSDLHSTMSTEALSGYTLAGTVPGKSPTADRQATDAELALIAEEACLDETTRHMGSEFVDELRTFLTEARDGLGHHPDLDQLSISGQILGSPSYMAPEQAAGRIDDRWELVDVYAIGVILYEMLTGRPPFRAGTLLELLDQVIRDPPVSIQVHVPETPGSLSAICLKCLQKDPVDRYSSAEALSSDLELYLAGKQPLAAPRRWWRFAN